MGNGQMSSVTDPDCLHFKSRVGGVERVVGEKRDAVVSISSKKIYFAI